MVTGPIFLGGKHVSTEENRGQYDTGVSNAGHSELPGKPSICCPYNHLRLCNTVDLLQFCKASCSSLKEYVTHSMSTGHMQVLVCTHLSSAQKH